MIEERSIEEQISYMRVINNQLRGFLEGTLDVLATSDADSARALTDAYRRLFDDR